MNARNQRIAVNTDRRGFTLPAVVVALLVGVAGVALVVDRMWIDAARLELLTAAESSALAAAAQLATDDLLRDPATVDPESRLNRAEAAAENAAFLNRVAGQPCQLDIPAGDLRFGKLVMNEAAGEFRFLETRHNPTTVLVSAHRAKSTGNPLALMFSGLTGDPTADVRSRAEASLLDHVSGVRPLPNAAAPLLPLSLLKRDTGSKRRDTWESQITQRQGSDNWSYDANDHRPVPGPDGIPELTLRISLKKPASGEPPATLPAAVLLNLGSNWDDQALARQWNGGIGASDLDEWGGELRLPGEQSPVSIEGLPSLTSQETESLAALIGIPRLALLHTAQEETKSPALPRWSCTDLVAIRILELKLLGSSELELTLQPAVIATRTALASLQGTSAESTQHQPAADPVTTYVYRLQLTY